MKTVLFHPRIEDTFRASYIPLAVLSIATNLNKNGHEAIICDRFFESASVEEVLEKNKPNVIGVSIMAHSFLKDAIVISEAAKKEGIPVVWGGSLPSAIAYECLSSGIVDYISFNEGEITWVEIGNAIDAGEAVEGIKGIGYLKDGELIHTGEREFIDLSTLPDLDWSLIEPTNYFQKSYGYEKMLNTYLSKGCYNKCAYCYNPEFHRSTRRCRPLSQVIREMKYLSEKYGADGFDFTDDAMFVSRKEVVDFCDALKEAQLDICWSGYLSVGILNTLEDYKMMFDAGCRSMIFGIESGSERVLKSVNKRVRLDKVVSNLELCHKSGIVPIAMFIIGLPGETQEDLKASVELTKQLKGTAVAWGYFTPLPGSKCYRDLVESGKIEKVRKLEDFARIKETEDLVINVTEIEDIDLITVRRYIRLRGLMTKTGYSMKEQLEKVILPTVKAWFSNGPKHFFLSSSSAVFNVVKTFTVFLHPKIRRRYGLYFTK